MTFGWRRPARKLAPSDWGSNSVDGSSIDLSDGRDALRVQIVSVETRSYGDLNEEHARSEGFLTLDELRKDLAKYYGKIEEAQPVTVISFAPISD